MNSTFLIPTRRSDHNPSNLCLLSFAWPRSLVVSELVSVSAFIVAFCAFSRWRLNRRRTTGLSSTTWRPWRPWSSWTGRRGSLLWSGAFWPGTCLTGEPKPCRSESHSGLHVPREGVSPTPRAERVAANAWTASSVLHLAYLNLILSSGSRKLNNSWKVSIRRFHTLMECLIPDLFRYRRFIPLIATQLLLFHPCCAIDQINVALCLLLGLTFVYFV